MDASILNALKDLSTLMATKHLRVQRKAKQIAANCQNNIVEHNKELVLPSLRSMSSTTMSEDQEVSLPSHHPVPLAPFLLPFVRPF